MLTPTDDIAVLHVDDEPDFAATAALQLERADGRLAVDAATGVDEAMELLSEGDYDCIVADYDMPGRNGIEFLGAVRERGIEVPFVLFTGKGSEEVASEAIGAGVTDYLQKEGTVDQYEVLADRIGNAVERARSQVSYREVFEKADIGLTVRDIETGELLDVNRRYCELLGYAREEALALDLEDVTADVPGYSAERARAFIERAVEEGEVRFEWPDETADGELLWVEIRMQTARIEGRERMLVTVQELAGDRDREQVLKTLHTAAAEIQACDSVEAACRRTVDAAANILEFELCSLMLHDDGHLVPMALSAGAPDDGARRMADDEGLVGKTYQTRRSYVVDDVDTDPDSDPAKETYRSGLSVPVGDRGVLQAVSVERSGFDETDRELAELLVAHTARTIDRIEYEEELDRQRRALEHQNERLDDFASFVSHDLRNPLNVLKGSLDMVEESDDPEHFERARRSVDRMERLIEDLLTLAREGKTVTDTAPVDLAGLVERCWADVATGDATLRVETGRTVSADADRLRQLLENLVRNSVEHGGGGVTVTVGDLDGGFYVEDDGPGIPEGEREAVFESGYSTSREGTGFGLAIVRQVARAHGWTVTATEGRGGGARFEVVGVDVAE